MFTPPLTEIRVNAVQVTIEQGGKEIPYQICDRHLNPSGWYVELEGYDGQSPFIIVINNEVSIEAHWVGTGFQFAYHSRQSLIGGIAIEEISNAEWKGGVGFSFRYDIATTRAGGHELTVEYGGVTYTVTDIRFPYKSICW